MGNVCCGGSCKSKFPQKRMELFVFLDPFCKTCLNLDYILYRLNHEYGQYFTARQILAYDLGRLNSCVISKQKLAEQNTSYCNDVLIKSNLSLVHSESSSYAPYYASLALKAAQYQGTKAGARFFRTLLKSQFFFNENIGSLEIIDNCAKESELDCTEFYNDLHSDRILTAIKSDFVLTKEMEITRTPSIVIFSNDNEKEAIKISGIHSYEIYESIVVELLGNGFEKGDLPTIHNIIDDFSFFTTHELSIMTGKPINELEIELKKLLLLQVVEKITTPTCVFWRKKRK